MANKTHIFGELDLDLTKKPDEIYDEVFKISEDCGYMPDKKNHKIYCSGSDNDHCTIHFTVLGKVARVVHYQTDDYGAIITPPHEIQVAN